MAAEVNSGVIVCSLSKPNKSSSEYQVYRTQEENRIIGRCESANTFENSTEEKA